MSQTALVYLCHIKHAMTIKLRNLLLLLLLINLSILARSNYVEHYNSIKLNISNGLPSNHVNDMLTDSNGFVWITTYGAGLLRYDGYTVTNFSHEPSINRWMMGSNSCLWVSEDKFHRLWVTYDEFTQVVELNTMLPAMELYNNVRVEKILKEPARRVYRDKQDKMWLTTASHIYAFSFDGKGNIKNIAQMSYSTAQPEIYLADIDGNGNVWAGINGTIYRLSCHADKIISHPVSQSLTNIPASYITSMSRQGRNVWIGSNNGLFRYNSDTRNMTRFGHNPSDASSLIQNYVSDMDITPDGRLLVATLCGVDILIGDGHFEHWTSDSPVNPLTSNFVNCIMTTADQIWIGTDNGGIDRLLPRQLQIKNYIHSNPSSISAGPVNAMYAENNGTVWVGTVNCGLNRKEPNSSVFQHWTKDNSSLVENTISVLAPSPGNLLWIGTWGGGVYYTDMAHPGTIIPLQLPEPFKTPTLFIGSLSYDDINHGLWIGANNGIYFYNMRNHRMIDPFKGNRDIRGCIGSIITRDGHLFIGHMRGMTEINLRTHKAIHHIYKLDAPSSHIIDKITCFCQTKDGTLWLGSNEYGLYKRMKDRKGHTSYICYTTKNGLPNNAVKGIVEDNRGMLWVTTVNGLSRFNPKSEVFTNYDVSDGLCSQHFYWNSAIRSNSGIVFLGTESGLIELMGEYTNKQGKVNMRFTSLEVNGELVLPGSNYIDDDISNGGDINIHESDRSLTISFSSLDYENIGKGIYCYRMKGFDDEWTKLAPSEHSIRFTHLPAGDYTIQVRYISPNSPKDEVNENQILSIRLHVKPYFWHSWWFLTLVAIMMASIAVYIYKKRVRTLRRRTVEELYKPIEQAMEESNAPERLQKQIQGIINAQRRVDASTDSAAADARQEPDIPFMDRVMAVLEKNYQNSEFGVNEISSELGMSRSVVGKRLNEETGMPASQFLRHYRLDIAYKLLTQEQGNKNVAIVAFKVGFNDPKYFTRCFTKEYGFPPSKLTDN